MVFSSYLFLFYFLPVTLLAYACSPGRCKLLTLTLASYLFYAWGQPHYCVLMLVSSLLDYSCGWYIAAQSTEASPTAKTELPLVSRHLPRTSRQRAALTTSLVGNLGLLAFFKYANLAQVTWWEFSQWWAGQELPPPIWWNIVLPLGISFYTFQSLSYTIDVYRGEVRATRNLLDFLCYVSMFPQLVAGPIIRFQEVEEQLRQRTHTLAKFSRGVLLFQLGLGKKVLLANPCGEVAEWVFGAATADPLTAWWGLWAYTLQIYFDFSGYSDMAIGLGLMFGFVFPQNFDAPYTATSLRDFWRRWHISLSTWLREYLYFSLGGNRNGNLRTCLNVFVVMLLGGLWHGASWTFALWGAYHGLGLIVDRLLPASLTTRPRLNQVATLLFVILGWVLFRAESWPRAIDFYRSLLGLMPHEAAWGLLREVVFTRLSWLVMSLGTVVVFTCPTAWRFTQRITWGKAVWCFLIFLLSLALLSTQQYNPFIYFLF